MASYTEGHLPIAGIDLHYYRMGTHGRPPVVFLHGFSDGGLTWLRFAGSEDSNTYGPDWGGGGVRIAEPRIRRRERAGWRVDVLPGRDHLNARPGGVVLEVVGPWLAAVAPPELG
jgi:pimeloyl-ACP methyl ester carboxylesterase